MLTCITNILLTKSGITGDTLTRITDNRLTKLGIMGDSLTCIIGNLRNTSGITRDRLIGMSKYEYVIINMKDTKKYHLQKKKIRYYTYLYVEKHVR